MPIADADKEKACGSFWYSDATYENRGKPYLYLTLLVPESRLEKLCNEINSGNFSELQVGVCLDVFQSEVDRFLWEPPMRKTFYIEEDYIHNNAYLSSLSASRSSAIGVSGATDTNDQKSFYNELFSAQTETLRLINQQLSRIWIVGILVAIVLFLVLLLK